MFRIARAGDEVPHARSPERKLGYFLDESGNCRFTFREWVEGSSNHGGARSRGYGSAGDKLEPQINLRKFDPANGGMIDDKRVNGEVLPAAERQPGHWRAEMVTLPLIAPVRELQSGEATYPVEHSPFAKLLSVEERERVGYDTLASGE